MSPLAIRALGTAVLVLGLMAATAQPTRAENCRPVMPDHPQDTRGYTFSARIATIRSDGVPQGDTLITMVISTVYADPSDQLAANRLARGHTILIHSNPCDGIGLLPLSHGSQVLVSTQSWTFPATWDTAVWVRSGPRVRLLVLHGKRFPRVWYTSDRRIA
ncbi:MAG: hypothetical protein QOI37_991, partial [Chloroflexota bacterium]|nr:hypothetical protein [Chloroflexota bacterium]